MYKVRAAMHKREVSLIVPSGSEETTKSSSLLATRSISVPRPRSIKSGPHHRWSLWIVLSLMYFGGRRKDRKERKTHTLFIPIRALSMAWIAWIASVVAVLSASLLYSHMITVDPCAQARASLATLHDGNKLPKIIHQQWMTPKVENEDTHRRFGDWHMAWQRLFPKSHGYTHMLWTDESLLEFIKEHYSWFLPTYEAYPANIQRVDASRYFLLHHYGGLYADMDYEPLTSLLWNYLPSDRVALMESPNNYVEHFQNALMSSPPGHAFWNVTFEQLVAHAHVDDVMASTGPVLLDTVVNMVPSSYVHTLFCENFQRLPTVENEASPVMIVLLHQVVSPLMPQKRCGHWTDRTNCQWGRHHNTLTWSKEEPFFTSYKAWLYRTFVARYQ